MATTVKVHGEEHHDHPHGWRRYVYSTNHKDIGTMYLVFALVGGLVGGVLSIGMRLELMHPGLQFFHDAHMFNVFTTAHGLIMIFFMVMPEMTRSVKDAGSSQKEILFMRGDAMSGAPIINGTIQLLNPPIIASMS